MLNVTSEIGRLRRVLVHEPGTEIDRMVPQMMEELLFDDILFGERAREEHRRLRRLLQLLGVEVVEARDLLLETLADEDARIWLRRALRSELPAALADGTERLSDEDAAALLVTGRPCAPTHGVEVNDLFDIAPVPNWCFQRDPQVVLGSGVVFSAMATPTRWREGLLARCLFSFHPSLRDAPVVADIMDQNRSYGFHRPRLEGGDALVIGRDVLAVGLSERTNSAAVEVLAEALARRDDGPRWLVVVHLPHRRAYMHLDTVFTLVDRDAALVHEPVIDPAGTETAETWVIDLHADDRTPRLRGTLLEALAGCGHELEPIRCGGGDRVTQQREQWTDGANAVALAPGVITLYDRNVATADELARHGFEIVKTDDLLLGNRELSLEKPSRTCILLPSHEISRARGGPHCLTHPLVRDDLD